MKLRYLSAALLIAVVGCADDSSDVASANSEAVLDITVMPRESKLVCELTVSCKDGTEINESESTESECAVLEARAQDFDRDTCDVILMKEEKLKVL